MKILLTGADRYIGAVLGPKLLNRGYDVVGLDTGYYRRGWLFDDHLTRPQVVTKDIRGRREFYGQSELVEATDPQLTHSRQIPQRATARRERPQSNFGRPQNKPHPFRQSFGARTSLRHQRRVD